MNSPWEYKKYSANYNSGNSIFKLKVKNRLYNILINNNTGSWAYLTNNELKK